MSTRTDVKTPRTNDNLPYSWRGNVEDSPLLITRDRRVQRIDTELVLCTESSVLGEHVIQPTDLAHPRHEYQDSTGVGHVGWILEAYALKEPDYKVVRYETFIKEVDSGHRGG